jgi:hypothetical protein
MPFCRCEKKRLDSLVVFGRQQTIKNRHSTLLNMVKVIQISNDSDAPGGDPQNFSQPTSSFLTHFQKSGE